MTPDQARAVASQLIYGAISSVVRGYRLDELPQLSGLTDQERLQALEKIVAALETAGTVVYWPHGSGEVILAPDNPKVPGECGTPSGHMRHFRKGETACEQCNRARREHSGPRNQARAMARAQLQVDFEDEYLEALNSARERYDYATSRAHALDQLASRHYGRFRQLYLAQLDRIRRQGR